MKALLIRRLPTLLALIVSLAVVPATQAAQTPYTGSVGVDPGFFTWITISDVGMWTGTCLPTSWRSGTAGLPGSVGATVCHSEDSPLNVIAPDAPTWLVVTGVTCFFHDHSTGGAGPLLSYTEHGTLILSGGQVTAYCPAGRIP